MRDNVLASIGLVLLKLGSALVFGFLMTRVGIIKERESLGILAGKVMLPLLAFKTVAIAELGKLKFTAILSCLFGKAVIFVLALLASCFFNRHHKWCERFIAAGLFSFHVTASNDFVIGIPIVSTFYGDAGMGCLTALVLGQYLIFQSISLSLVEVGLVKRQSQEVQPVRRVFFTISKNILWNPLIISVVLGLLYKAIWFVVSPSTSASDTIPEPLYSLVVFFSDPYPFLALFLTGVNLTSAFERVGGPGGNLDILYFVGVPVWLCIMKNFVCPLAAMSLMASVTQQKDDTVDWVLFCLLYGSIPTSNAPLFVALASKAHVEVIAAAIFLGLLFAVPSLFIFASMQGDAPQKIIADNLTMLQKVVTGVDVFCVLIALLICWHFSRSFASWRRLPAMIIMTYAASIFLYDCSVFLMVISRCRMSIIFGFFQMQCRVLCAIMPAASLWPRFLSPFNLVTIIIVVPLLLFFVPPSTLNEVCHLHFSFEKMVTHSVFVTVAFCFILILCVWALCNQIKSLREASGFATMLADAVRADASLPPTNSFNTVARSSTPPSLQSPQLPEADDPLAEDEIPLDGRAPDGVSVRRVPSGLNDRSRSKDDLVTMGYAENLAVDLVRYRGQQGNSVSPRAAEQARSSEHSTGKVYLIFVALGTKSVLLLFLQCCISWSVLENDLTVGSAHLQAMFLENFLEHGQGFFLLLLLLGLFDTPVAAFFRSVRTLVRRSRRFEA
mmetsp:Transcript_27657/g.72923  ORF Transcript_27657/g.72923 Transcript_27657/m.72923 type:complete len:727 (-) Transcript_27657:78-2258(-)